MIPLRALASAPLILTSPYADAPYQHPDWARLAFSVHN
jgi:hypothetical protein